MWKKNWPFILALVHTLILACYALPQELIPARLQFWSTSYTRPLFHQQWNLFAPDVPPCGCTLTITDEEGVTRDLAEGENLLGRRIVKWGCRSMSNYRDSAKGEADLKAWPGFQDYIRALTEQERPEVHVRRTCFDEIDGQRVLWIDALDQE